MMTVQHLATTNTVLLTIQMPAALEDDMADLLQQAGQVSGFSILKGEGMGETVRLLSPLERVLGRCDQRIVLITGEHEPLKTLLSKLAMQLRNPEIRYWLTPVIESGSLA